MSIEEPSQGYISLVLTWMNSNNTTTFDFTQPYIKNSFRYVYPLFMFLHAVVGLIGLIGNLTMIIVMGKRRLYHDQTFFFLGNLAFSDVIKCIFVLPISLANMLIQNWVFGSFMCFFLPMIQLFPIHASMLTFLMIAIDRYRLILNPFKARLPAGLCTIAVWVASVCVVLPHAVYIKYVDLGAFLGNDFEGVGICFVNKQDDIEGYLRAMFVTMYAIPLAITGFLYVKISAELKVRENTPVVVRYSIANGTCARTTQNDDFGSKSTWLAESTTKSEQCTPSHKGDQERDTQDSDEEIDLAKEKRTQNYLIAMVTFFAICWCPMNIFILVHYFVHETDDNKGHIDITFITFAWFGFLSTCVNPILFASWRMPSATKERLKGYFRFSNRRQSASQLSRTEVTETYAFSPTPSPREPRKMSQTRMLQKSIHGQGLSPSHPITV